MAASMYFIITDEKNDQSVVEIPIETGGALTDIPLAVSAMTALIKPLITGGVLRAGFKMDVPIVSTLASADSDLQEKALFQFRTENNFLKDISIPTFNEQLMVAGSKLVNRSATAVVNFVNAMEDGFTGGLFTDSVEPVDSRGEDLTALEEAREAWGKYRRG